MKNKRSHKLYTTSASIMLTMILLLLTSSLLLTSRAVFGMDSVTGAVWTTDPNGERVNGNLYTKAQDVYLAGGPHKESAAGLPDGIYYFQVTDPAGKQLLSKDKDWKRRFNVTGGYIDSIDGGTHKWNIDTTRDFSIVVQLWPFECTPNRGGVYKVWVTREDHYNPPHGCFGFIPSLSKTDSFKVRLDEVPKYFELWVTTGISGPPDMEFYVNYTIDGDGNPDTKDPLDPWTTGQLTHVGTANGYDIFREDTSFPIGTYIYWQFFARRVFDTFTWTSEVHGPELIDEAGKVNKEILFMVYGHKYDYRDGSGLEDWTIELYKDGEIIAVTHTDDNGYYEFIGIGPGNYKVCEVPKFDEGWANATPACHEFTIDGNNGHDYKFDFYNYKMLRITDTSDCRYELSSFNVVFTPSNEDPDMYKLSSTNPGSFYTNVVKYGTAGTPVRIEVDLPPDQSNADFDSPNFILHHTYIGSTPVVDVHVYGGRLDETPCGSIWVPDWSKDVTNLFDITPTDDGKHVTVEGNMPDTGEVFVTVHIDFQISGSLAWEQVQMFTETPFEYIFADMVYFSAQGVTVPFYVW